jgi:hypothetical protein
MVVSPDCSVFTLGYRNLAREVTISPVDTEIALVRSPLSINEFENMEVKRLVEVVDDILVMGPKSKARKATRALGQNNRKGSSTEETSNYLAVVYLYKGRGRRTNKKQTRR